jgi:pimeloyl-ACP methyl ester carboxylesterase
MSKANPSHESRTKSARSAVTAKRTTSGHSSSPLTISARWLLGAIGLVIAAAALCAWGALCLTFWQGSWQLLYHPQAAVVRTPANVGLAFDDLPFAATEAGLPQLHGWLIPAAPGARYSRYTVLYLHGANGNLGDTLDELARLHNSGLNVFAFDYRGYGQSRPIHPSEAHWREDAEWALQYLTGTRHISINSVVLIGHDLGANLALEVAAAHPDLAGVVLQEPGETPLAPIFLDPRARMVPAHLLVRDHWDAMAPAAALLISSLWFYLPAKQATPNPSYEPEFFKRVPARKVLVWLPAADKDDADFLNALTAWLDDLHH